MRALRSVRGTMSPIQGAYGSQSVLLRPHAGTIKFSPTETKHLVLGTGLVTAAGVSFFLGRFSVSLVGLVIASLLFSLGFILHELAHKYVAQGYGLWAEFRLNMTGVLLTAISIVSPLKFIAPGAVVIAGYTDNNRMGRTAIAGPVVNLIIASAVLIIKPLFNGSPIAFALLAGAAINSFLAVFNLIPFSVFDGLKVYRWNRSYWTALFLVAAALTIYTYFGLGSS